jgi:hypothetical protein
MSFFATKPTVVQCEATYTVPTSEDPVISAYYAQLTEKERTAHAIAVVKLGTSYDVSRTHGFLKWKKKQTQG